MHIEETSPSPDSGLIDYDHPLIAHAKRELTIEGGLPIDSILRVFQAFVNLGLDDDLSSRHSMVEAIHTLLKGELLSPLSSDPDEWTEIGKNDFRLWQNVRDPEAFSFDNGVHYFTMSDVFKEIGNTIPHILALDHKDRVWGA